jgi:transglutaminase-like putative cysteine protease
VVLAADGAVEFKMNSPQWAQKSWSRKIERVMAELNKRADFLASTEIVDWRHPDVNRLAQKLADGESDPLAIARQCFEWVRDEIQHSVDHCRTEVTCRASKVLTHRTGFCYAKSHLLAALLRANNIPAGFCYQRLSVDGSGSPFCLHGLNAVWLPEFGWYRIDSRGNKSGVAAEFTPPVERLAFPIQIIGEIDLPDVLAEPLPAVIDALLQHDRADVLAANLPDVTEMASNQTCS